MKFDQNSYQPGAVDTRGGASLVGDGLANSEMLFPPLQQQPARTVSRDRWEKLVSSVIIPKSANDVWDALVSPERIANWFGICRGYLGEAGQEAVLDFEDGEFFLLKSVLVEPPHKLKYLTRWLGVGQATSVTWTLESVGSMTQVTVTEEAENPPWDWQTWNGGGWPGILDQLANYLRTNTRWRWPWRRMGPYAQIELPLSIYTAWDELMNPLATKYWLLNMNGTLAPGATIPVLMGDASGLLEMTIQEVVQPGERPPSFLPYVTYTFTRPAWKAAVPGRLWFEPAGWGKALLQIFHHNWEALPGDIQLSERRLLAGYCAETVKRARQYVFMPKGPTAPHNW